MHRPQSSPTNEFGTRVFTEVCIITILGTLGKKLGRHRDQRYGGCLPQFSVPTFGKCNKGSLLGTQSRVSPTILHYSDRYVTTAGVSATPGPTRISHRDGHRVRLVPVARTRQ